MPSARALCTSSASSRCASLAWIFTPGNFCASVGALLFQRSITSWRSESFSPSRFFGSRMRIRCDLVRRSFTDSLIAAESLVAGSLGLAERAELDGFGSRALRSDIAICSKINAGVRWTCTKTAICPESCMQQGRRCALTEDRTASKASVRVQGIGGGFGRFG